MTTKIKEKLIKWSRNVEEVGKVSKCFTIFIFVLFIILFLSDIGIKFWAEGIYSMLWGIFGIVLGLGVCVCIVENILYAIDKKKEYCYKNRLITIILSEKDAIDSIFILILLILFAVLDSTWIFILWFILYIILPRKVANYFEEKLLK